MPTYPIRVHILPMMLEVLSGLFHSLVKQHGTQYQMDLCQKQLEIIRLFPQSFLATGDSFTTLAGIFRVGISTVHVIIKKTCKAIWDILSGTYMKPPTRQDWINIEKSFYNQWNCPNCVDAVNG